MRITQTVKAISRRRVRQAGEEELAGRAAGAVPPPAAAERRRRQESAGGRQGDVSTTSSCCCCTSPRSQQWTRVLDHLQQGREAGRRQAGHALAPLRHPARQPAARGAAKAVIEEAERLARPEAIRHRRAFLAEYLVGQSAGFLQANEMLALLDACSRSTERQPEHLQAMKAGTSRGVYYLQQTGQADEALRLQKQLAVDYPRDYRLQYALRPGPGRRRRLPRGLRLADVRVLDKDARWDPVGGGIAAQPLRAAPGAAGPLRGPGRLPGRLGQAEPGQRLALRAVPQCPDPQRPGGQGRTRSSPSGCRRARWRASCRRPSRRACKRPSRRRSARATTSTPTASRNAGWRRWREAALFFARHRRSAPPRRPDPAARPIPAQRRCRRVRKTSPASWLAEIDKLSPNQIRQLSSTGSCPMIRPSSRTSGSRSRDGLRKRWAAETKAEVKHQLGQSLVQRPVRSEPTLAQAARVPARAMERRAGGSTAPPTPTSSSTAARSAVVRRIEDEAFAPARQAVRRRRAGRPAARPGRRPAPADRHACSRPASAARMKTVEHPEKLTRTELQKKQEESRRLAREGFADRLRKEIGEAAEGAWRSGSTPNGSIST